MNKDEAIAATKTILAYLEGGSVPNPGVNLYPRIETIDGVRIMLGAPINPLYKASTAMRMLSQGDSAYVADPSNGGKLNLPTRSPMGFPLVYATNWLGNVSGPPAVAYRDGTYDSDATVLEVIKGTAQTPEQAAAIAQQWLDWEARFKAGLNPPNAPPLPPGGTDVPIGNG